MNKKKQWQRTCTVLAVIVQTPLRYTLTVTATASRTLVRMKRKDLAIVNLQRSYKRC